MSLDNEYLQQLEMALLDKHTDLEKNVLPGLRENLHSLNSAFNSIHKLLLDKGLLKTDPYKYEQKTDLTPPSAEPYTDAESGRELSFRMAAYSGTLDYLNNFFHVSADTLDLPAIKKILTLIEYIKWTDFSSNSSQIMTRSISVMLDKIKDLKDEMCNLVITSALGQLRDRAREIKVALKKVSIYQRERYKFQVRSLVTSQMNGLSELSLKEGLNDTVLSVKVEFPSRLPASPFYRDLIIELLEEDYGDQGEARRNLILQNLEVTKTVKKTSKMDNKKEIRRDLMKIVGIIAKCSTQLYACSNKLENNHRVTHDKKKSFGEALSFWLKNIFASTDKGENYELNVVDPMTSLKKREIVNYEKFTTILASKIQLFRNLETRSSPIHQKVFNSSDVQLLNFIENSIHDLRSYHKRLEGFNDYFKAIKDMEIKAKIKNFKIDCDTLKYQIGTITRNMNEISSTMEEEKQLKALGLNEVT